MTNTSSGLRPRLRSAVLVGVLAVAGTLAACEDFLTADNPAAVPVDRLNDTSLVELMHNSAIAGLQGHNYFWFSYLGATFTDELRNNHPFIDEVLYDRRSVAVDNSYNNVFTYGPIMRARWLADSVAGRMLTIYGDSARRDVRLARVYAIAGYHFIHLGEGWCEVPIPAPGETYGALVQSNGLFDMAIDRFDKAITVAQASRTANEGIQTPAAIRATAAADTIRNLAYIGIARAALSQGDLATAAQYARLVQPIPNTTDFEFRVWYNANTTLNLHNLWAERLAGGAGVTAASISNTPFLALDDPRVPHPINTTTGAPLAEPTQMGAAVVPNSPPSFSTFNNSRVGADPTYGTSIRIASLLEARYIIAEAEGPTAENIAFIESRRTAFPSSTATDPTTAANFMVNLMDQRRRDFFIDGHRMGDLRRYARLYDIELWPTGPYPGSATAVYGEGKCWPLNIAEITNNPMVPKPYTPPAGP